MNNPSHSQDDSQDKPTQNSLNDAVLNEVTGGAATGIAGAMAGGPRVTVFDGAIAGGPHVRIFDGAIGNGSNGIPVAKDPKQNRSI